MNKKIRDFLENKQLDIKASIYAQALWYDYNGDWESCHDIIQDINTQKASQIHAYLHRKEGDVFNAKYWYSKAKIKFPDKDLESEFIFLINNEFKDFK